MDSSSRYYLQTTNTPAFEDVQNINTAIPYSWQLPKVTLPPKYRGLLSDNPPQIIHYPYTNPSPPYVIRK
jgi:hypothetical protein